MYPTLCNPMDCSLPGFLVHLQLPESTQTNFHHVGDAIQPSHPLISLRMDWFDLLAVQRTFKSLLQHHSPKASILQHLAFFIVQLSHPYMTTGKTIALTRWTFAGKVMSLHFNMLSRLVITFLPRSKCLLISWLQSPYAMILKPPQIKSHTVSHVSPAICCEVMVWTIYLGICLKTINSQKNQLLTVEQPTWNKEPEVLRDVALGSSFTREEKVLGI